MTANEAKDWLSWLRSIRIEHLLILALFVIVIYSIIHPEKILVWKGILQSFIVFSKNAQKKSINNRVVGSIKHATKKMTQEEQKLYPESIKIRWKDKGNEDRESFLKGNQVIIRMSRTDNICKITSIAALEMAKVGVLTNGKRYMKSELIDASDFMIARKLVSFVDKGQSLTYFDEIYFRPLYDDNETFRDLFNQLVEADKHGMYIIVFLNEIKKLADKLFPEPNNSIAEEEIIGFLKFLWDLCQKGNDHKFRYKKSLIKVDVAFAGATQVLENEGHDFYVNKCHDAFENGVNTVYVFSRGLKIRDAIEIERKFREAYPNRATTKRTDYTHIFRDRHKTDGVCIEFQCIDNVEGIN